jgi:transcriptional regulator with XRE-family HTH domain
MTEGEGERPPIEELIGVIIREARLAREVTQEGLAEAIGRSRTTVVNIESGVQGVTLSALYDIAFALSISVFDLLPDDPHQPQITTWAELTAARRRIRELESKCERASKVLVL